MKGIAGAFIGSGLSAEHWWILTGGQRASQVGRPQGGRKEHGRVGNDDYFSGVWLLGNEVVGGQLGKVV